MPIIIFKKKRITEIIEEAFGHDPYWDNVVLLMHMDGDDNGTTFIDETGLVVTRVGDTITKSSEKKFGTASAYFDGTVDYLTVAPNSQLALGTADFTIEGFINRSSQGLGRGIFRLTDQYVKGTIDGIGLAATNSTPGQVQLLYAGTYTNIPHFLYDNQWHHFAVCRSSGLLKVYIDGVEIFSTVDNTNYTGTYLTIGGHYNTTYMWHGYIDEFRITKGISRYTENFQIPTTAFPGKPIFPVPDPYWNSVKLALHMNGADNSTVFTDEKGKVVTTVGNAKITTSQSKFGNSSGYFDGTGDYIRVPSHPDFDFAADDFTIDCFFRTNKTNAYQTIVSRGSGGNTGTCFWLLLGNNGEVGGYIASVWSSWNFGGISAPNLVQAGQWYHLAMVRSNGTLRIYLDGVQVFSYPVGTVSVVASTDPVLVGSYVTDAYWFDGNLNDVRITKGVARYTDNFTAPTGPFSPPV